MQNLNINDKVVVNATGQTGTVVKTDHYNVVVLTEEGTTVAVSWGGVTKQEFLTEYNG